MIHDVIFVPSYLRQWKTPANRRSSLVSKTLPTVYFTFRNRLLHNKLLKYFLVHKTQLAAVAGQQLRNTGWQTET
jgi:hypothetical protein